MADDAGNKAAHDDERIDVDQEKEVRYWAQKFGVTQDEIRQAVKTAGPTVKAVRQRLAAHRSY